MGNEKEGLISVKIQTFSKIAIFVRTGSSVRKKVGVYNHLKTVSKLDEVTFCARSFFTLAQSMRGAAPVSWGGGSTKVSAVGSQPVATSFFR